MNKHRYVRRLIVIISFLCIILFFSKQIYQVQSGSMEDALFIGDFILINNFSLNKSRIRKDDICAFKDKLSNTVFVKRVIGFSGDTIKMQNQKIFINDRRYNDPPTVKQSYYVQFITDPNLNEFSSDYQREKRKFEVLNLTRQEVEELLFTNKIDTLCIRKHLLDSANRWIIPEGCYFVIGDNRYFSRDSRNFGAISEEKIVGKVTFILFNYHNGKFRLDRFLKKIE